MGEVAASTRFSPRGAKRPLEGAAAVDPGEARPPGAQLRALQAAATELAQLGAIEQLAAVVDTAARDGLAADLLVIAILEEDGRHLRVHVGGVEGEARQRLTSIPIDGPSLIAHVVRSGRPVYQGLPPNPGEKPRGRTVSALRPGTESVAALPLPATDGALGVIVLSRRGARGFSADDIAFLGILAMLCALAVERVQLSADRSHVREILRRRQLALRVAGTQLRVGRMRIDLEQLRIEVDGRSAHLTPTEIRLLMFLAEEPGRPRTRGEILRHLWRTDYVGGERACDAHIWNLRRKIERDPSRPELVLTRRGVGYALDVA